MLFCPAPKRVSTARGPRSGGVARKHWYNAEVILAAGDRQARGFYRAKGQQPVAGVSDATARELEVESIVFIYSYFIKTSSDKLNIELSYLTIE